MKRLLPFVALTLICCGCFAATGPTNIPTSYLVSVMTDTNAGLKAPTPLAFFTTNAPGPYNVRWFGAVGDGVTDDTAAITNALYYAAKRSDGTTNAGGVFFPAGTYLVTNTLPVYTNTVVRGETTRGTTIYQAGGTDTFTVVDADESVGWLAPVEFHNLIVRYPAVANTNVAFQLGTTNVSCGPVLKNCEAWYAGTAVYFYTTVGLIMERCYWRQCYGTAVIADGQNTAASISGSFAYFGETNGWEGQFSYSSFNGVASDRNSGYGYNLKLNNCRFTAGAEYNGVGGARLYNSSCSRVQLYVAQNPIGAVHYGTNCLEIVDSWGPITLTDCNFASWLNTNGGYGVAITNSANILAENCYFQMPSGAQNCNTTAMSIVDYNSINIVSPAGGTGFGGAGTNGGVRASYDGQYGVSLEAWDTSFWGIYRWGAGTNHVAMFEGLYNSTNVMMLSSALTIGNAYPPADSLLTVGQVDEYYSRTRITTNGTLYAPQIEVYPRTNTDSFIKVHNIGTTTNESYIQFSSGGPIGRLSAVGADSLSSPYWSNKVVLYDANAAAGIRVDARYTNEIVEIMAGQAGNTGITVSNSTVTITNATLLVHGDAKPTADSYWDLGSSDLLWKNLYASNVVANSLSVGDITITNGLAIASLQVVGGITNDALANTGLLYLDGSVITNNAELSFDKSLLQLSVSNLVVTNITSQFALMANDIYGTYQIVTSGLLGGMGFSDRNIDEIETLALSPETAGGATALEFTAYNRAVGNAVLQYQSDTNTGGLLLFSVYTNGVWNTNGIAITATNVTVPFLTLTGDCWDDTQVPALAFKTGATAPGFEAFCPSGTLLCYTFAGAGTDDQVYFTVQLPHSYKEGTDIYPHVHWAETATTGAGTNVVWGLEYSWANVAGTFGAPSTIYVTNSVSGTNWKHSLSSFPTITGTSKTVSSILVCRMFRNANTATADDYDQSAACLGFDIHYQIDTLGSKNETSK